MNTLSRDTNPDKQAIAIANLKDKVSSEIVGVNIVNLKVSQARHIVDAIDDLTAENERLRNHLIDTLAILALIYVPPDNMKKGFVEQSKIHAAHAALQPKEN